LLRLRSINTNSIYFWNEIDYNKIIKKEGMNMKRNLIICALLLTASLTACAAPA